MFYKAVFMVKVPFVDFFVCLPVAHFSCCEGLVSFQIGFSPYSFGTRLSALKTGILWFLATSAECLVQGIGSDLQSLWQPRSWQTQKSMLYLFRILTVRQHSIHSLLLPVHSEAEITATLNTAGLHLSEREQTEISRHHDSLVCGDGICEEGKPSIIFNKMKQQASFRTDCGLYHRTDYSRSHSCSFRNFITPFGQAYKKKALPFS